MLAAASGQEALDVARGRAETIDLLVTDVVMPGMGGRELAEKLEAETVLYISGYTEESIVREPEDDEIELLQKPFEPGQLAAKVRSLLDAARLRNAA